MDIRSADDPAYIELEKQLAVLGDIDVEIGGGNLVTTLDIIFTAHGNESKFQLIDEIVAAAPLLERWRIYALKPPLLEEMDIVFMKEHIRTQDIWFKVIPLASGRDRLGLKIAIADSIEPSDWQIRQDGALIIIESYLGERACSSQLDILGFIDLPADPDSEGFVHLKEVATQLGVHRIQ